MRAVARQILQRHTSTKTPDIFNIFKRHATLWHLVDISLGGLKMIGKSTIAPGKDQQFSIYLPENHTHKSFTVKAKACWSKPDINPDYIASGHSFTALSPESIKLIKMLIRRYDLGNNTSNNSY